MTTEEKLEIIEKYGKVHIDSRSRQFSETGNLYEYEISILCNGGAIYRTGETRNNAIERMYYYLKGNVSNEVDYLGQFP